MIVLVDANVIVGDPNLHSEIWTQLTEAVQRRGVQVYLPEIALEEAVAKRRQGLKALGRKISASADKAPRAAQDLARDAQEACMAASAEYAERVSRTWEQAGFKILQTAQPSHVEVARRAIKRERPFNEQGGGYRDTLHWLTLLSLASENPHDAVVLVTGDKIFSNKAGQLMPELQTEFGAVSAASILLCTDLDALEVPGHYASDPVLTSDYDSSLRQRLLSFLSEEYALRNMKTVSVYVPYSDWDDLTQVHELQIEAVTSRQIERVSHLELQFRASAVFSLRGTYIHNDEPDFPEISTKDFDVHVELTGMADTLDAREVGALRTVQAVNVGQEPMLLQ
jgi:hypothetical protein